jgi:hypothetical protein
MRYAARIEGKADGTVLFQVTATPLTDFLTNRSGFVVLHPLVGVVNEPVEIVHTDGKKRKTKFPKFISPGQPVFEIRSLKHTVMPGVTATVLMEGNKFEMEDHRNWMDASYKTYVCSLLDPWPYTLPKGESFTQSITLTIEGKPTAKKTTKSGGAITVELGGSKGVMPSIATGVPMAEAQAALEVSDLIEAASPAHLICQIDGRQKGQADAAAAFRELRERTGIPSALEIVLPAQASAEEEMHAIASELRAADYKPDAIIIPRRMTSNPSSPTRRGRGDQAMRKWRRLSARFFLTCRWAVACCRSSPSSIANRPPRACSISSRIRSAPSFMRRMISR